MSGGSPEEKQPTRAPATVADVVRQSQVLTDDQLITEDALVPSGTMAARRDTGVGVEEARRRLDGVVNSRYVITAHIGDGGMGSVYRVLDQRHPERHVVLK